MARKRKRDPRSVMTVRMDGELYESIRRDAIQQSVKSGRAISMNNLCVQRLEFYPRLREELHETQEDRDRLLRKCRRAGLGD